MSELCFDNERVGAWVAQQVNQTAAWGDFRAFGVVDAHGQVIAGVVLHLYNGANAVCHIAIAKPTKLLKPLLRVVAAYAFGHCGLKRLTGMVPTNEQHIIDFDLRLGWQKEFVMKDAAPGADMQVLVMWRDACPWFTEE